MEAKAENLEEMFDILKPIIPDFYSCDHQLPFIFDTTKPQFSDQGYTKTATKQHLIRQETTTSSHAVINPSSVPQLISFENNTIFSSSADQYEDSISLQRSGSTATRSASQAQEHLMAERKRRESLTQLFINLSKLVPGLKKLDKASLLEDGIKYLQALEEQVKVLEEQEMISETSIDNIASNPKERSINNNTGISAAPEIQARISDKHVLIKIFCKKQMDLMSAIPGEMDKICLNVLDMRIMPFGGAALDITILAQMQSEHEYTSKDIVDHLHTVFLNRHV